jgi:serine/threonine protein kinase
MDIRPRTLQYTERSYCIKQSCSQTLIGSHWACLSQGMEYLHSKDIVHFDMKVGTAMLVAHLDSAAYVHCSHIVR